MFLTLTRSAKCSHQREKRLPTATGIYKIENRGLYAFICGSKTLSKTSFRCSNGLGSN